MSEVLFSSSFDDKFPPQSILENNNSTLWVSTGLYPQEIFIQLENEKLINSANISSYGIKKISFETCENESAVNFVKQAEMVEVPFKEGKIQEFFLNFLAQKPVRIVKVIVADGYDDFAAISKITFK